jgi:hypothetical protein
VLVDVLDDGDVMRAVPSGRPDVVIHEVAQRRHLMHRHA